MPLQIGDKAPDFILASTSGKQVQLSEDLKNKPCIIYFYPKDFTPGCTKEACAFRDNLDFFSSLSITVLGISTDTLDTHLKFKAEYQLSFELLADTDGHVSKSYQALVPIIHISKRITYLLDKEHIVRGVFADLFSYESHIKEMIKAIKAVFA